MSKTITLRIEDDLYKKLKEHAENENRTLSNFIETATIRYIEKADFTDEFETNEILQDKTLLEKLKQGSNDAINKRGRFV